MTRSEQLHVVFLHLDLGIGGAEQLIVNLALASLPPSSDGDVHGPVVDNGNNSSYDSDYLNAKVSIFTTHCDQSHCFDAVRQNLGGGIPGRLADSVNIYGSFIPANIFGCGTVFFSTIRMLYISLVAKWMHPDADVFVLDVLPTPIPFLVWSGVKCVLYYCHFPDKLLTRDTVNGVLMDSDGHGEKKTVKKRLKRWYRYVMDSIEEWSMSYSDLSCVNSKFTRAEVLNAFPRLARATNTNTHGDDNDNGIDDDNMQVLYPAIDLNKFIPPDFESKTKDAPIVSLNRFERKKNIQVLLEAYAILHDKYKFSTEGKETGDFHLLPRLIISGGYDPRNAENVEYLSELKKMAKSLNINEYTDFRPSVSDQERAIILQSAICVVYTPHREHFGIVPLEAMYAGSAVVAGNSGGPIETIINGQTGILVDMKPGDSSSSQNLAGAIRELLENPKRAIKMGRAGHLYVKEKFGLEPFRRQWKHILLHGAIPKGKHRMSSKSLLEIKTFMVAFAIILLAILAYGVK